MTTPGPEASNPSTGTAGRLAATVLYVTDLTYLRSSMSQSLKAAYYQALKGVGAEFSKPYRNYSIPELKEAHDAAVEGGLLSPLDPTALANDPEPEVHEKSISLPVKPRDPDEVAGVRQNTKLEDEPIRQDPETGFIWYQEEVQKKAYAAPRGRRVLKYDDPGAVQKTIIGNNGESETFEMGGDRSVPSEVKITLPSYQVGIYRDPRHPFKTITYNGMQGFDLFEVEEFYGGADRVPEDVKRIYVANVLCYDIRTVVRDIETEYRRLQLAGKA